MQVKSQSLIIPWKGLVRDFGGEGGIRFLRIFSKPSAINKFGMLLLTTVWVG